MSALETRNWEVGLVFLFAIPLMVFYAFLMFRLKRLIRRKGYQSPFWSVLMIAAYLAIVLSGFLYDASHPDRCWSCSPAANPEYFRAELVLKHTFSFMANFLLATTALLVATATILVLMPRRMRRAGRRRVRFPWRGLARVWQICLSVTVILGLTTKLHWTIVFKLFVFFSGMYAFCSQFAKRSMSKPLEQLLEEDQRPPALYLRPFDSEDIVFAVLSTEECCALGIPVLVMGATGQTVTFEEFFAKEVTRSLGPFIALGDPRNYLPPAGATRIYLEDERWQEFFRTWVRESVIILMTPSMSENLRWELSYVKSAGLQTKLFIFTSPPKKHWYSIPYGRSGRRKWRACAAELEACGYSAGDYPGDGSVVGFDVSGKAIVMTSGARNPWDYLDAVQKHLAKDWTIGDVGSASNR